MRKTSANDILLYELCPQKWDFMKHGKKGTKQILAFYRFSSALHEAVKKYIREIENPIEVFESYWGRYKENYPLIYREDESWDSLQELGKYFLNQFPEEFKRQDITPILTENRLSSINDNWIFTGQPDLIGYKDGKKCYIVLDYKTTDRPINPIWIQGSDQLTGFAMLVMKEFMTYPPIDILVCNFIKEDRKIEWIHSSRNVNDIENYRRKIDYFVTQMDGGYYPKRSLYAFDSPCNWCDFPKECYGVEQIKNNSIKSETEENITKKNLEVFAFSE